MGRLLAAATLLGLSGLCAPLAQAQTAVPYNWTGPYVGVNLGGSSGDTSVGYSVQNLSTGSEPTMSPSGFEGGGQFGYNYQLRSFVLGLETDIQYRDATSNLALNAGAINSTFHTKQGWFGTVRPRFGIAPSLPNMNLLLYITGGLAYGHIDDSYTENRTTAPIASRSFSNSSTNIGWTVGGGAEMPLGPVFGIGGLVAGIEYLHFDYGTKTLSAPAQAGFPADSAKFFDNADVVRLRLSYRFGVPTPPPAATPVVAAPPAPPPAAAVPARQMFIVFFEFDKSSLTPDGQKIVDAAAAAFKNGRSDIAIAGYTDLSGTQQYNLALSHRRADAVKAALAKDGVPAGAIGESWFGKENPRVPTADGVREPQNRRVEIRM
jgi:OmpA-OmpF porin, OOP family